MSRRSLVVMSAGAVLVALALFGAFYAPASPTGETTSKPRTARETVPAREPSPAAPAHPKPMLKPLPAPTASVLANPPDANEASLMARLRELRGSNPELTLKLAREAQILFKNSPDAAEQSWFVVKALSDLGRHDEARVEGQKLVKEHPGTRWAEDTHRHLFVNPATHPAERGYGKDLDL